MTNFAKLLTAALLLFPTLAAPAASQAPLRSASETTASEVAPGYFYVISPWGFGAWYYTVPGWNILYCSGTGLAFRWFAPC